MDAADRVTGTVKWFSDTKGFGFITIEDGEKDCFVHYSAILGDGYRSLQEGDRVAFRVVPSPKGPEAANVTKL
ncbi:MAG TPA: cold-shock protein [Longimicrobiales bacterium]